MKDVRELKDKAAKLAGKGKLAPALEVWQQVVGQAPDDIAARQKIAELYQRLGKPNEAVRTYEDVAARYAKQGHFFKASAVCRLLLGIDPKHERTQALIAELYARDKTPPRSAKPLPRADAFQPAAKDPAVKQAEPELELDLEIDVELAPPPQANLPTIPLFSTLSAAELTSVLASGMEVRLFQPGEVIVAEGAPGDSMFALAEGQAGVFRGHGTDAARKVAEVTSGDIFGEAAMVSGAPRLASVVADGEVTALELSREAMEQVTSRHPSVAQKLDLFYRQRLLRNVLRASPLLRLLPEADKVAISKRFQAGKFARGEVIIKEGTTVEAVHLLLRGVCEVHHGSGERYPDLSEGDLFGELSILLGQPASATVIATGPVLTLRLPADEFRERLLAHEAASAAVRDLAQARILRTEGMDEEHGFELDLRI